MATETLEQIRERIEAQQYSFWYSEKHAQHYHMLNSENPTDLDGRSDPIRKNFAETAKKYPIRAALQSRE